MPCAAHQGDLAQRLHVQAPKDPQPHLVWQVGHHRPAGGRSLTTGGEDAQKMAAVFATHCHATHCHATRHATSTGMSAQVVVVGAGIAGCTLAWALARDGRTVHVVERDMAVPDTFRGELLQPGGVHKLQELGLGRTLQWPAGMA
jgi:predicted membrane-bound mannosyltransferase